jgi:hypothetical protein
MGSYAYLNVAAYDLLETKGSPEPVALTLFDESDRRANPFLAGEHPVPFDYVATVACVRDRLETMGFTMPRSRAAFAGGISKRLRELAHHDGRTTRIRLLKRITFDQWLIAFRELKSASVQAWNYAALASLTGAHQKVVTRITRRDPALFRYMLDGNVAFIGFPSDDFRVFLRAALEGCAAHEVVEYNASTLVTNGYLPSEDVATAARAMLLADFPSNAPIIVAMEGKSDIMAVESAMRVLVPHLRSYYSFLDFSAASAKGGATGLMEMVKAFIGARVANRMIAIFDNDAAGCDAARLLSNLPGNIRVLLLPNTGLASSYPTIGPSGPSRDDVNGRAASIELYFGEDVLRSSSNGDLVVVRWNGLVPGVAQYQGELEDKPKLQRLFAAKVERALSDPKERASQDWSGMSAVIAAIRMAFL